MLIQITFLLNNSDTIFFFKQCGSDFLFVKPWGYDFLLQTMRIRITFCQTMRIGLSSSSMRTRITFCETIWILLSSFNNADLTFFLLTMRIQLSSSNSYDTFALSKFSSKFAINCFLTDIMFTMNFQKRKKATLRSSKIILEDWRVAFFTL